MLAFTGPSTSVDERKTARMEQRTKPHIKIEIQRAAALLGVDETAFVTSVAYQYALDTLKDYENTILASGDREAFFAALDAPATPTDQLLEAAKLHKRMVQHDD